MARRQSVDRVRDFHSIPHTMTSSIHSQSHFPLTTALLSSASKRPIYTQDEIECLIISSDSFEMILPQDAHGMLHAMVVLDQNGQNVTESPPQTLSPKEIHSFFSSTQEIRLSTHRIIFIGQEEAWHIDLSHFNENYERKKSGFFSSAKCTLTLKQRDPNLVNIKLKFKSNRGLEQFVEVLDRQLKAKAWEKVRKVDEQRDFGLRSAGVGGLQKRIEETSSKEHDSMQVAFKDLDSLMNSARDMVQLARRFSSELTKREADMNQSELDKEVREFNDMLMGMGMTESVVSRHMAGNMFYVELARQLTDFLQKPLERSQGLMTLIDAYCLYNRARGTDLISPEDMLKACSHLEELKLPMRMQTFESGVIVLTTKLDPTKDLMDHLMPYLTGDNGEPLGMTAVETAHALHISVALAESRLEQAERELVLCRDEDARGVAFYENLFFSPEWDTDYRAVLNP